MYNIHELEKFNIGYNVQTEPWFQPFILSNLLCLDPGYDAVEWIK